MRWPVSLSWLTQTWVSPVTNITNNPGGTAQCNNSSLSAENTPGPEDVSGGRGAGHGWEVHHLSVDAGGRGGCQVRLSAFSQRNAAFTGVNINRLLSPWDSLVILLVCIPRVNELIRLSVIHLAGCFKPDQNYWFPWHFAQIILTPRAGAMQTFPLMFVAWSEMSILNELSSLTVYPPPSEWTVMTSLTPWFYLVPPRGQNVSMTLLPATLRG